MKLNILFGCLALAVCNNVDSLATNNTDLSSSANPPQSTIKTELDRETPPLKQLDSGVEYYNNPTPNYAMLVNTPRRRFHPLARLETRGMMFDEMKRRMNSFWEGWRVFGMLPLFRTALGYFFYGDNDGYTGRYRPVGYGRYRLGKYRPEKYPPPSNQFDALPPESSYYNNQFAQPNQPPPIGASPYYQTQPGAPYAQSQISQPISTPDPYYRGQPLQAEIQTARPSYDRNQLLQPNAQPQSLVPSPAYYAEQPASSNVQAFSDPTSAFGRNGKEDTESQLEAPPTLSPPRDQRAILSDKYLQPSVQTSILPETNEQPK